jgi:hypothetical protein
MFQASGRTVPAQIDFDRNRAHFGSRLPDDADGLETGAERDLIAAPNWGTKLGQEIVSAIGPGGLEPPLTDPKSHCASGQVKDFPAYHGEQARIPLIGQHRIRAIPGSNWCRTWCKLQAARTPDPQLGSGTGSTCSPTPHYEFGRRRGETGVSLGGGAVVRRTAPAILLFDVATCVAIKLQQSASVGTAARATTLKPGGPLLNPS